jgi:teichuronic acid biosynthesis glycosyltransferase TuaC
MLRVLTLSTLFPNEREPTLGIFVERQTRELAARGDVELEVVAPVGMPRWPLSRHPHYAPRTALPAEEKWQGLKVHRPRYPVLPVIGTMWTASRMAGALLPKLRELRVRFAFDVIDAEFFWPDGPAAVRLGAELGVPVSIKARGADIDHWLGRFGIRGQILRAARSADGLLAVSAALKRRMVAAGIDEAKIAVHYTGVDFDRFGRQDRAAAKAALGVDGPLVATVGALIPRKGQQLALMAIRSVPGATLMLAGDGPDRSRLEAHALSLGLSNRVRFLGARPHEEVARLLAAADVMLLPSLSEGLANVWVEALASGTPVVAGNIEGADEAIEPSGGRLVPLDPAALGGAVRELLADPPDPQIVRESARRFSWERNTTQLFDHLSKMVKRGPGSA